MKNFRQWIIACSFALAALGFLLPLWPLSALGVALASGAGYWVFGVGVGLLLDIAWGAPPGVLHVVLFPFALFALLVALIRMLALRYVFTKIPQEKI
jgi:hypothetical protein